MKTRYDAEVDALVVELSDDRIAASEEVAPGIVVDFDAAGRIVGFEVLNASTHVAARALREAAE